MTTSEVDADSQEGYIGETDSVGRKHGTGVQWWADGSKYEGEFVNDLKEGIGVFTWSNGEFYHGSFYKDYRHGKGTYSWPGGCRFVGKFYLNRKEGYGTQYFPNGTVFKGLYREDERFGPGVVIYPDGRQDVGLWHREWLLRLVHYTLTDFPELRTLVTPQEDGGGVTIRQPLSQTASVPQRHVETETAGDPLLFPAYQLLVDERFVLPPGIERYSTDSDHLPVPRQLRAELHRRFFGERGSNVGEDLALPLHQRMQSHVNRHRLEAQTLDWDVDPILSGTQERFGPKGPQEQSSEQLIVNAALGDCQAVCRILRSTVVHPDVADLQGHTALLAASVRCHNDVIHLLLDMGADVNKLSDEGVSALAACLVLHYPVHTLRKTLAERGSPESPSKDQLQVLKMTSLSRNTPPQSTVCVVSVSQTVDKHGGSTEDIGLSCFSCTNQSSDGIGHSNLMNRSNEMNFNDMNNIDYNDGTDTNEPKASRDTGYSTNIDTSDKVGHRNKVFTINIDNNDTNGYSHHIDLSNENKTEPSTELNVSDCAKINSGRVIPEECSIQLLDRKISEGSTSCASVEPQLGRGSTVDSAGSVSPACPQAGTHLQVTEDMLRRTAETLSCMGFSDTSKPEQKTGHSRWWGTIELLLTRGADPNACSVPVPALFLAIKAADVRAVRLLLQCGACPNVPLPPQCNGLYPLHIAAGLTGPEGPQITELLLHALADPDLRAQDAHEVFELDKDMVDPQAGNTSTNASGLTHVFTLPCGMPEEGGRTPLHVACQKSMDYTNARDVIHLLLSRKANTSLLWSGHSPLSLAIASGNDLAVDELLAGGANPNLPLARHLGNALCAVTNIRYNCTQEPHCRTKLLQKLIKAGANILMPVVVGVGCGSTVGTAVDYAYYSYNQDWHIANSPYHTLSPWEREAYNSRRQLLGLMGELLREAAVQMERERLQQDKRRGVHSISPVEKFLYVGAGAKPSGVAIPQWQVSTVETPMLEHRSESGMESKAYVRKPLFRYCYQCGRSVGVTLKTCTRCHEVNYCSKACKLKAWANRHREECLRIGTSNSRNTQRQDKAANRGQAAQSKSEM